jgi:predicted metal-binding protein
MINVCEFASQLGIQTCLEFNPELLVPEERVRGYCTQNRCGNYGKSHMCPPFVPPIEEVKTQLKKFQHSILLRHTVNLNIKRDWKLIKQSMTDFHNEILQVEEFLKKTGIKEVWGMTAGTCGICEVCSAKSEKPCVHPDKARASLEALGIDVVALMVKLGLDHQFHADKVMWTGCVLY